MGGAELAMVQDVLARPVVVGKHGVAGIVPSTDRHVDMNGSVVTRNNEDKSVSTSSFATHMGGSWALLFEEDI